MSEHLAQLVDAIPPTAIPVATSDAPAPAIEPETVAAVAVEDGAARFAVAAVDAVAAVLRGHP